MKLIILQKKLDDLGVSIFTFNQLQEILGTSKSAAKQVIERYTKKGYFVRLKRGLYMRLDKRAGLYTIANKLYEPSYISLETALSYYGLIPEIVYGVTSVVPTEPREFVAVGVNFSYHSIKKKAFTNYSLKQTPEGKALIAEKEKAVLDYFYYVFRGLKPLNERMAFKKIDKEKLKETAEVFENKKFLNWLDHDFPGSVKQSGD